jgi:uncharacterized protein YbcC (UPF0753/DUF2309 family)
MVIDKKIKTWRSNCKGSDVPVGLLQAQLSDAANLVEMFTQSKHFEGVPMKVLVDYLTVAIIDELKIDHLITSDFEAQLFRQKIDNALYRAKLQTEGGNWYDDAQKSQSG